MTKDLILINAMQKKLYIVWAVKVLYSTNIYLIQADLKIYILQILLYLKSWE